LGSGGGIIGGSSSASALFGDVVHLVVTAQMIRPAMKTASTPMT
jgi:hypothetical protein